MRIEPRFLQRHLHEAAVEQLASNLQAEGYEVQREARPASSSGHDAVFDLLARRGEEKIFYEVKVVGEDRGPEDKHLGTLSTVAREEGGHFRVVVVRPRRDVDVRVTGIEEALRGALAHDPTGELDVLGYRFAIDEVQGVEIERLQIEAGGKVKVVGTAVASVSQFAKRGSFNDHSDIPFGFDVVLDQGGHICDAPQPTFKLDLSLWRGGDGGS